MGTRTPAETANQYIDAYNSGDIEAMLNVCTDDVYVTHHNRELLAKGKAEFKEMLTKFGGIMPGKHFGNRRGFYVDGNSVIVEHTWYGTSLEDAPGFASEGESVTVDLCTCFTVRDGLVAEYHDYG